MFAIEVEDSCLIGTGIYVHYLRLRHNNGVYRQSDYPRVACHCWLECAWTGTEFSFCVYVLGVHWHVLVQMDGSVCIYSAHALTSDPAC